MAEPAVKILEALDHIVAGRKPPDDLWADPRVVGKEIQQGGVLACRSTNWAKMGMAVVLAYVINGWRLPAVVADADEWIWDWWERCFRDSFNGLALYKEFGSRRYSWWSMLAVVVVYWLTGQLDRRDLHAASWTWLVAFWSLISFAAYTKPYRPRYTQGVPDAPLSVVAGERSWIYRIAENIGPGEIEREACSTLLGELLGGYRARIDDGIERRIWDRCSPKSELSKIVRAPWRQLVRQIGDWGPGGAGWLPGQTLHVLRWRDGSVACVISACRGQSTAPLYALAVVAGEIRALYADSGERKTRNIEPGVCYTEIDYHAGRVVAYVERPGVAKARLAPGDEDAFEHPDRNARRLTLHPGGSPVLYHVTIGPGGAKIVWDGDEGTGEEQPAPRPRPPEPPKPPEPPPVDPGGIMTARAIEHEIRIYQQRQSKASVERHAASIAIQVVRAMDGAPLDIEAVIKRAKRIVR